MLEEQNAVVVSTYKETYKEVSAVIVSILIVCVRVLVVFGGWTDAFLLRDFSINPGWMRDSQDYNLFEIKNIRRSRPSGCPVPKQQIE
jgi:hypothetical protein